MAKISRSPRYVIDRTGERIRSVWGSCAGGGLVLEIFKKTEVFFTYEGVIGS